MMDTSIQSAAFDSMRMQINNLVRNSKDDVTVLHVQKQAQNMAEDSKKEGIQGRNEGTFHNFGKVPVNERKQIDYFFGSNSLNSDFFSVVNDTYNNEYVSDHNGIVNYFSYNIDIFEIDLDEEIGFVIRK